MFLYVHELWFWQFRPLFGTNITSIVKHMLSWMNSVIFMGNSDDFFLNKSENTYLSRESHMVSLPQISQHWPKLTGTPQKCCVTHNTALNSLLKHHTHTHRSMRQVCWFVNWSEFRPCCKMRFCRADESTDPSSTNHTHDLWPWHTTVTHEWHLLTRTSSDPKKAPIHPNITALTLMRPWRPAARPKHTLNT